MHPMTHDVEAYIKVSGEIAPQSLSGTTAVNGDSVDRLGYNSLVLFAQVGDATGSPSAFTATVKLQESDDDSTFTDISGATFVLDADGESGQYNLDLAEYGRYIRAVATPAFTAGTSPTVPVQATIILGGAEVLPAT